MTREEACEKAQIIDFQGGYTVALVIEIYDDIEAYLDKAAQEARTWDAHVAFMDVKRYLEGN